MGRDNENLQTPLTNAMASLFRLLYISNNPSEYCTK